MLSDREVLRNTPGWKGRLTQSSIRFERAQKDAIADLDAQKDSVQAALDKMIEDFAFDVKLR